MIIRYLIISFLLIQVAFKSFAQEAIKDSLSKAPDSTSSNWSFSAAAYYYILPHEKNTTTLLGYADHKSLHFEARYNYEGRETGSLFGGYMFKGGGELSWSLTPMVGFVFGNTDGFAPGLLTSFAWKKLDFYSESEYVIDFAGKENNFFYTWTELAITPVKKFRTGVSANRTRLYQSELEVQKGLFAQYSFCKLTAGLHYFNPFSDDYFLIATMSIEF